MEDQTLQAVPAAEAPAEETAAGCPCRHKHREAPEYDALIRRLNRIEGQVRGVRGMVEKEAYCTDILTQVSATTRALQSVALTLLDEHLSTCVVRAARAGGDEAEIRLAEASDAIARLVRS